MRFTARRGRCVTRAQREANHRERERVAIGVTHEAHARAGDIVVGISTSGRSPNVVRALEAAREKGAFGIAFTGRNGGPIAKAAKLAFKAPEAATPRVQELHILAWHGICEIVEAALHAERSSTGLAETGS